MFRQQHPPFGQLHYIYIYTFFGFVFCSLRVLEEICKVIVDIKGDILLPTTFLVVLACYLLLQLLMGLDIMMKKMTERGVSLVTHFFDHFSHHNSNIMKGFSL